VIESADYVGARALSRTLDREPLADPRGPVAEHAVTADLRGVRQFALEHGRRAGISGRSLASALLVVQELAANAVVHGPGHGTLRTWVRDGELVFEVRDAGEGPPDPLVAHLTPDLRGKELGGLWMARLLCDAVEVRSGPGGFVVRVHLALAG
jgi:anti-sigma regulatory factor (Ser/Thr protein kinase)